MKRGLLIPGSDSGQACVDDTKSIADATSQGSDDFTTLEDLAGMRLGPLA